jgi:hypothetical protein
MDQIGENDLEAPHSFLPHTHPPPPDSIVLINFLAQDVTVEMVRAFSATRLESPRHLLHHGN